MKEDIKISIVTPTFNSEDYLEECILSIIHQDYQNYEHIIIDGGSTDGTLDIIKKYENKYSMRWISEQDQGMYDAINKGFRMASGNVFAWLNSDDYYYPGALETIKRVFSQSEVDWVVGIPTMAKEIDGKWFQLQMPNLPTVFCSTGIKKGIYDGRQTYFLPQENCFWTKKLWEIVGGVDSQYRLAGDYFLWKKFAKATKLYTVNSNLAAFRVRKNQLSANQDEYYREVNRKKSGKTKRIFTEIYLQLYSLVNYRKYVIRIK